MKNAVVLTAVLLGGLLSEGVSAMPIAKKAELAAPSLLLREVRMICRKARACYHRQPVYRHPLDVIPDYPRGSIYVAGPPYYGDNWGYRPYLVPPPRSVWSYRSNSGWW